MINDTIKVLIKLNWGYERIASVIIMWKYLLERIFSAEVASIPHTISTKFNINTKLYYKAMLLTLLKWLKKLIKFEWEVSFIVVLLWNI